MSDPTAWRGFPDNERVNPDLPWPVDPLGRRVGEIDFVVELVCSDRGHHATARLGWATRRFWDWNYNDDPAFDKGNLEVFGRKVRDQQARPGDPDSTFDSYRFWCAKCDRTPRIRHEKLTGMTFALVRAGVTVLDLSYLA